MINYPTQSFRNIILIGSVDQYGEMDDERHVPWIDTEDMEYFRNETIGHCVVMDSEVWHSLKTKPLHGRLNIVLCDDGSIPVDEEYVVVKTFNEAMWAIWHYTQAHEKVYILGGLRLYKQFRPYSRRVILTLVQTPYKSGKFFPKLFKKKSDEKNSKRVSEGDGGRSIL